MRNEAAGQQAHPVRMELTAYYYDPNWNLLWGESDGKGVYLPVGTPPLAMRSGQRVRLEGTVVPAKGFRGDEVSVTVLADNAWPTPIPTAGQLGDVGRLDTQWVDLEGYVFAQSDPDPAHVLFVIYADNRLVNLRLLINGTDPIPQLAGARVRVKAVYVATRDPSGGVQQIDCWTSRREDIEVLGWLDDDFRFKAARTPIEKLAEVNPDVWVKVAGELQAQDPGKSITLRDDTGVIEVATAQPEILPANVAIELVGRPVLQGYGWTLRDSLYRKAEPVGQRVLHGPGRAPLRLRQAGQVLRLPPDDAEKRHPVSLRGVVTWADERADFFYLQDASGGVCVRRAPGTGGSLAVGTQLAVTGVTVRGSYVPEVDLIEASYLGTIALPPARVVTLEQAMSGAEEGQRVEMRGFVYQVVAQGDWTRLDLAATTGEFSAYLPASDSLSHLEGAIVRVRGVCDALSNAHRELQGIRLWVQDRESVLVDEAAPTDPFNVLAQTVSGLRQFSAAQSASRRVRLTATVLLQQPGRYLFVQDETGGLFVLSRQTGSIAPGARVEVVGLPGRAGNRQVLREATWRSAAAGAAVPAQVISDASRIDVAADATLVQITGKLRQTVEEMSQLHLSLEADGPVVEAVMPITAGWTVPVAGSRLELTGVYVVEYDEYRRPHSFRLELRGPADVRVTAAPPWWTMSRTLVAIGLLACGTFGILGWVVALRRRVQRQTEQIRAQLDKEARLQAELERSSRLDSLGVLAGGIAHDFNNLLTAVMGNIGLIKFDDDAMRRIGPYVEDAERATRRAADVTQQLLTFAKGGNPVRKAVNLPDIVREAVGFARHGSNLGFEFDFAPDLPPADADPGQISRVVHNLVINAIQAMPGGGRVRISVAADKLAGGQVSGLREGEYLRLTVEDNGPGIDAATLERLFEPYFTRKSMGSGLGLATTRSIVIKHGGQILVASQPGEGTVFRIWLPVAKAGQADRRAAPVPVRSCPRARVLVMDDEGGVRRLAGRFLTRAGHEAVMVEEGAAAVEAYSGACQSGHPFDVVVLDLTVPGGMGGKEAAAAMLKLDPSVRLIASSGYSNDPVMSRHRDFGFSAVIQKPYDFEQFTRTIDEVCGGPRDEPAIT